MEGEMVSGNSSFLSTSTLGKMQSSPSSVAFDY